MVAKVLIVGSGITSALTCTYLRREPQNAFKMVVWDKARGVGGRMSTSRNTAVETCTADLGAQYITTTKEIIENNKEVYTACFTKGLLQPLEAVVEGMHSFPDGTKHYVATNGINSIVKKFLIPDEMLFQRHVFKITVKDNRLLVETKEGHNDLFDIVILTMPVPQILQLEGCIETVLNQDPSLQAQLSSVKYSSRFALAFFYDTSLHLDVPWSAKYISDDEVIRYVAIDNKKRNKNASPTTIVFHTTIKYGEDNIDRSVSDVQTEVIHHIEKLFPGWPKPQFVKCQKWRYSQVTSSYPDNPGCITLLKKPLMVAGGDGFKKSTFDGCMFSAHAISNVVENYMKSNLMNDG